MAIKSSNKGDSLFTEINITPLTDIFLVLLIIMMVMAPMFQSVDKSIEIPEINSGVAIQEGKAVLSVSKEGHFYLDSREINSDNLVDELTQVANQKKEKEIVLKADASVKSKEIMKIMRASEDAGFEKLVVAGEPLSKKDQKQLEDKNKDFSED
jgi:biopolymer transport protein ExbD/biopolymer transport protein TolR